MSGSALADNGKEINTVSAHSDRFLRLIVTLLILAFPTVTLFINHGDSGTLGLLTLIGIWVWVRDGARAWLNRDSGVLCLVCALFYSVVILSYVTGYQTEDGFHFLGRYARFLFIVPAYLAVRRYPPTAKTVFIGLALGALVSGILASLELVRAHGPIRVNAQASVSIIFGDLTTTMVLCMVAGFGLMAASRRNWSVPLLILCLVGGVTATLLSGTRGAWLPLFLLIPALATPAAGFLKRRYLFSIVMVIIAVFSSSYFITRIDTQGRLKNAVHSTKDYFIALRSLDAENARTPAHVHCGNQASFLAAWLKFFSISDKGRLSDAGVVKDPLIEQAGVCAGNDAIRLHNSSQGKWLTYSFPRVPQEDANIQSSKLLVRGAGLFNLGKSKEAQVHFDSPRYVQLSLEAADWPGSVVRLNIRPNETAWLVPLDSYAGEYTLSIANTSVGKRFEMWRVAWWLFMQHPLLGVGTGAYQLETDELINRGQAAPFIGIYDHPHNDYLDALSSRGILGFAALLAILLIPASRFLRATRSPVKASHAIGLAGILTVAGFAIYALTDTIFLHSMMITWYVIYLAVFYSLLDADSGPHSDLRPSE